MTAQGLLIIVIRLRWLVLSGLITAAPSAWGFACTSTGGNWATAGTWTSCNGTTPQATDTATISSGTVTLNTSATVSGLTVNGGTLALGNSATVRTLTVNGNLSVASGATVNVNNNTVVNVVNVTGNITNNGTLDFNFDANSLCTVNFTGAGTQTVSGTSTGITEFYNVSVTNSLTINKSGAAVNQTGNITVGGNLTLQAGAFGVSGNTTVTGNLSVQSGTLSVAGTTAVTGTTDISGTMSITAATGTKTFTGAVTINSGGTWNNNNVTEAVTFNGGLTHNGAAFNAGAGVYTFDTNAQTIGGSSALAIPNLTVNVVTLTNTGVLTVATALSGTGGLTNNSTLNIGGTSGITTLTATLAGNTVNYTGGAQTVKPPVSSIYHHLGLGGSGTKTLTGLTTVNGDLTLSGSATATTTANFSIGGNLTVGTGTTFTSANFTNLVTGITSVTGTLAHSGIAAKTYAGAVTINTGGAWTNAGNAPVSFRGGLNHSGTTFTAGTGIYTFDTNAQSIGGSSTIAIPSVVVTAVTLTNNGTLTVATSLSGAGSLINSATGTLNIGGTSSIATLTASAVGNTVNYTLAGAQAVIATPYHNLGISGSGVKSLAGATTVAGTLTLSTATLAVGANTLTLNGPTTAGTPANLTTTASSSLVFGGSSAGVNVPSGVTALNNLTINNANGVALTGSPTLNGVLTLTSGNITTAANTLKLAAFCPGSLSRTSGYIIGNLTLIFPTGSTTCSYPVGDSTGYAPVTVAMSGVTVAGALTARVDQPDHPDTVSGVSGIDVSKSANHYWTLTAGTPTITYSSYSATFQFCSNTGACTASEVDAAATAGNFIVLRKSAGAWSTPSLGTVNAYSTQATSITSANGLGEFAVGEVNLCYVDSFVGTNGSAPGSNWTVGFKSGTFGNPVIFNNRLRLSDASTNSSTYATLNRLIPAAGNKVTVEFEYYGYGGSTPGADGIAVVLSDASVSPAVGAFGGSLGYAQKSNPGSDCTTVGGCPGFVGGWLGVGMDEFGNYATNTEGRNGGSAAAVADAVSLRGSGSGLSGYRFVKGTSTLSPAIDGVFTPAHLYRIIVDHSNNTNTYASVERNTGSGYTTLIAPFDIAAAGYSQNPIPTSFNLSFTSSTGSNTNIHEIRNLSICTAKPLVAPTLHHIEIDHSGSACTSGAASVTVKACADAACSALYAGSVTVNLSSTGGAWSTNPVTFTGGSTTVTLTQGTAGAVTLGGAATSPTTGNATQCFNGATQTCTLTFAACTFDVIEVGAAAGSPIFTKLANTAFNLSVLSLSGANQTANTVQLVDASSGTCSTYTVLGNTTTTVPSAFTANQSKTFSFTYNNAAPNVRVRVTNSASVVSCSSDNFAIRPQSFNVTSGNATNGGASSTPVLRAGTDSFSLLARAVYGTTTTTGYTFSPKLNTTDAGLIFTSQANLGTVTPVAFPAAVAGVSTASGFKYDEVGNFNLAQNAVYDDTFSAVDSVKGECTAGFGNGIDANGKYPCQFGSSAAGAFGRFVPDHFTVLGTVTNSCVAGTFTYMGQTFSLSTAAVVEARNASNGVTKNYTPSFSAPGTVSLGAENADNGVNLSSSLPSAAGSWASGVYTLSGGSLLTFTRPVPPSLPSGPYESLAIGLTVTDSDVSTSPVVQGADFNPNVAGGSTLTHKAFSGSPLRMRYGRLRLLNAYGSELLALPVTLDAQYWSGTAFISNAGDACTAVAAPTSVAGLVFPVATGNNLSAGETTATVSNTPFVTGNGGLSLSKPGAGNSGYVDITVTTPSWLQYNWTGAGNANPSSRATFGVFKSPLIYRRENY